MNDIFSLAVYLKTESTDSYLFSFKITDENRDTEEVLNQLREALNPEIAHVMEVMVESSRSMKSHDGNHYEMMIKKRILDMIKQYSQED